MRRYSSTLPTPARSPYFPLTAHGPGCGPKKPSRRRERHRKEPKGAGFPRSTAMNRWRLARSVVTRATTKENARSCSASTARIWITESPSAQLYRICGLRLRKNPPPRPTKSSLVGLSRQQIHHARWCYIVRAWRRAVFRCRRAPRSVRTLQM